MIFSDSYTPRFNETDRHGLVTPVALYNYLQDAAIGHGEAVGMTPNSLHENGYAWILNRVRIAIDRYPSRSSRVDVKTWGSNLSGLYAIREWVAADADGTEYARGTSRWVLVDVQKKRAVRLPSFISEEYGVHAERGLVYEFTRTTPPPLGPIQRRFHVRASDLDTNQHANSSCYFDWCIEAVPDELLGSSRPKLIDITYKREALFGDEILATGAEDPSMSSEGKGYVHTIHRASDDALLAYGSSHWE